MTDLSLKHAVQCMVDKGLIVLHHLQNNFYYLLILQEYEATAKRKREETRAQDDGTDLMKGLGHVQQIELLHGFNDMTSQLKTFLVFSLSTAFSKSCLIISSFCA